MYRQGGVGGQRHPQQQLVLPEPGDVGVMIVRGTVAFARRNKVITGAYLFGILSLLVIGGGTRLTYQQVKEYNRIMDGIDLEAEYQATQAFYRDNAYYQRSKGWFWSCDAQCQDLKRRMEHSKQVLDQIKQEGYARMSDAKSVAGIFSEVGVQEAKDSFWEKFGRGKDYAKRQSMWDAMFIGIRSMGRDESMVNYALRVLMQVLVNFSIGLCMALVFFIIGLWSIVRSYQPNPLVAVLFFLAASCAAFAFVATYLLGIFGATAGGLYGMAKVAESAQRQQRLDGGGRQQREQMGYRPHYE